MYLKKIEIENTGPIDCLSIEFAASDAGGIKPLVIVGENGTGKTIVLSYLVNTLITAKQAVFDDTEVEHGRVYKYRSPQYIRAGAHYSYGRVEFGDEHYVEEWQLDTQKLRFEEAYSFSSVRSSWAAIPEHETSHFHSSLPHDGQVAKDLFDKKCCLYFPVNRFEDPAWLNIDNLKERASYTEIRRVNRFSNRSIVSTSPLKANRNWLLDLIFDRQAFEISTPSIAVPIGQD